MALIYCFKNNALVLLIFSLTDLNVTAHVFCGDNLRIILIYAILEQSFCRYHACL